MKSECLLLLSRKMLSLYSSVIVIDGVKVSGACRGIARSPESGRRRNGTDCAPASAGITADATSASITNTTARSNGLTGERARTCTLYHTSVGCDSILRDPRRERLIIGGDPAGESRPDSASAAQA